MSVKHCTTAPALRPCGECKFNPTNQPALAPAGEQFRPTIRGDGRCHHFVGVIREAKA